METGVVFVSFLTILTTLYSSYACAPPAVFPARCTLHPPTAASPTEPGGTEHPSANCSSLQRVLVSPPDGAKPSQSQYSQSMSLTYSSH